MHAMQVSIISRQVIASVGKRKTDHPLPSQSRLGVLLDPFLCSLVELLAVTLVYGSNLLFHCIVGYRFHQDLTNEDEDGVELGARLPLIWLEETQAHATIVGYVRVVYLGFEGESRGLEWVVRRHLTMYSEDAALEKRVLVCCHDH